MKSLGPKTLLYPTPVLVVGSYDDTMRPNAMTAAWGGICCSKPPCVTVSLRKATYSYSNIRQSKGYTLNIPSAEMANIADYLGIYSGRDEDKISACSLTPVKSELVLAPYYKEFPMVLECKVLHEYEIGLHTQFIGEILDVKIQKSCLQEDGKPNLSAVDPLCFIPDHRSYHTIGKEVGKAFSMGKKTT